MGISAGDICVAASWASPHTFVRFYHLDVTALMQFLTLSLRRDERLSFILESVWWLWKACIMGVGYSIDSEIPNDCLKENVRFLA